MSCSHCGRQSCLPVCGPCQMFLQRAGLTLPEIVTGEYNPRAINKRLWRRKQEVAR